MELVERKEEVRWLWGRFLVSQRRICELLQVAESSQRYVRRNNDEVLRAKLVAAAREKPRWGYRRLQLRLEEQGMHVNHKRVYRVYREAGQLIRRKRRKRLLRAGFVRPQVTGANQEWALDFVHDAAESGRKFRVLSVIDVYTRECLALEVDSSFASRRVTRELERIVAERGIPEAIRCDNGPKFTSRIFWRGRWNGRSSWCTSNRDGRCRTHTWKVSRKAARRVLERQLVRKSVGRAAEDRRVVGRVQRRAAAQRTRVFGAATRPTARGRSYAVRRCRCRMIECAEPGGGSNTAA